MYILGYTANVCPPRNATVQLSTPTPTLSPQTLHLQNFNICMPGIAMVSMLTMAIIQVYAAMLCEEECRRYVAYKLTLSICVLLYVMYVGFCVVLFVHCVNCRPTYFVLFSRFGNN